MTDDPALLPDEWRHYLGGVVDRLRDHAVEVADALDAAVALRQTLTAANLPEAPSLTWAALVTAVTDKEIDRALLQAQLNRALNPAALPKENHR